MKAVVMAGGEGTRLRPLTSNQPKPMVPIVGKPCMEHILELLGRHGFDDVIVTLAFMPQAIRSYFGDGESLGLSIGYSVEESPLGTAGSVRLASGKLDDTVLVISGDALCDIDLAALFDFHRSAAAGHRAEGGREPLEFGIVVTDGRPDRRFLEKPSGARSSRTPNTGIYVLGRSAQHVPTDRPYDFSKALPAAPGDGPADAEWSATALADIGNLTTANDFDARRPPRCEHPGPAAREHLDRRGRRDRRPRGRRGPAFVGNYWIAPGVDRRLFGAVRERDPSRASTPSDR
jgi:mannose-1-phosphate guanylyltransferase/phosphomannomutase